MIVAFITNIIKFLSYFLGFSNDKKKFDRNKNWILTTYTLL